VARPARVKLIQSWRRRYQLGRWVRPVLGDTSLVGKLPEGRRGRGYLGRRNGRRMTVTINRVRLRAARRERSRTPARLRSRLMISTPHR